MDSEKRVLQPTEMGEALRMACKKSYGVVDTHFLCQPVSALFPADPLCVAESAPLHEVMDLLRNNRVGCVLITNDDGELVGIFSERDYVLKVYGLRDVEQSPISRFMTTEPVTIVPDETVAYALNLMSQGGFRHLPLVDDQQFPIGMISVKDAVDKIVGTFIDDLLAG